VSALNKDKLFKNIILFLKKTLNELKSGTSLEYIKTLKAKFSPSEIND
jgi:hypothetical protein